MIKALAEFFRLFHYMAGISLPPPGTSDRKFVLAWLTGIASVLAFGVVMFYVILALHY